MSTLDEDLVQRVSDLGTTSWSGTTYRHTALRRDPLSGAGARLFGGRWNPRGAFTATYLAHPGAACVAELERMAELTNVSVPDAIRAGRTLHTIEARGVHVLDLTSQASQSAVGLEAGDIADDDHTACQAIGQAAHFLGHQGVLAPSATGIGLVLAAFDAHLEHDQLQVTSSRPLTEELLQHLR